jgi:HK97 family phage prohead protease
MSKVPKVGGPVERRYFDLNELRAEPTDDGATRLTGYAAVFNSRSVNLGGFVEEISRGAFAESLADGDIRALWNHDTSQVLGRTKAGTLRLREDDLGLRVDITLPDTTIGRDAAISIERGDVDQMSFAFNVVEGGDEWREEDGRIVRTLRKVRLFEVSPVTFPAYPATSIGTRDIYGDIPGIPAELCGATSLADQEAAQARARMSSELKYQDDITAVLTKKGIKDEHS